MTVKDIMWLPPAETWWDRAEGKTKKLLGDWLRKPQLLMSGSASNYLSSNIIQDIFGGVSFTFPTHEYMGLWTSTLDDTSTGSTSGESAYTSYARTQIGTANDQITAWNAATGSTSSTVTNKNNITFPTSTGGTSTITFAGVLDAATTGNMLVWMSVTSTVINNGNTPQVNAGALTNILD